MNLLFLISLIFVLTVPGIAGLQIGLSSIAVEVTENSAAIRWRTDQPSDGSVEIGTSLDQLQTIPETTSGGRTDHEVVIENLNPYTLYYYRIKSFTATEEHSTTFRSLRTLLSPPTGVRAEEITHAAATIVWDTHRSATGYAVYINAALRGRARNPIFILTNLTPTTQYAVQVTALDSLGRESAYSDEAIFTTQEAPATITFLTVTDITNTTATVSWKTDRETSSMVQYDKTLALRETAEDPTPTTSHVLTLIGLAPDTRYFFKVVSGSAESQRQEFRTLSNQALTVGISDVAVEVSARSATITWNTNEEIASRVVYSTDDSFNLVKHDNLRTRNHRLVLENLQPQTRYFFKIVMDTRMSGVMEFTTSEAAADFLVVEPLPKLTNSMIINVTGRTRPNSRLYISVNEEYQIRKMLNATEFSERIRLRQTARYNGTLGKNVVKVEAWDARGNKDTFTAFVTLDNIPPRFELDPIPRFTNAAVLNITGAAEQNVSVEVFFNNVSVATFTVENATFSHGILTQASANYSMRITARDRADNLVVIEQELIIDKSPPLLELQQFPRETHFKLFKVEGKTEPNAFVSVVNFGEFEGCQDAAFIRQFGECTEYDDKTKAYGAKFQTQTALDPFGIAYGAIHTTRANDNGGFSIIVSLIPGKQGSAGENKLVFHVADAAGNVNDNSRAVIQYTPGCPDWHISNVQSMPFNIYTEELHERDLPASIFYTLDYIGNGVPDVTQLMVREDDSGASLIQPVGTLEVGSNVFLQGGVNNTNEFVAVNEQGVKFSKYDPETNKIYVYAPLLVNRYTGSLKNLPDEFGVFLRNYLVYTVDGTYTAPCILYPVASFDIQKPENLFKWLSPNQINQTIERLDQLIKGTNKVIDYTTTAARVTLIGCGAGLALKYLSGFAEKQEGCDTSMKWIFEMCDRILCPKVPENCNEFDIEDGMFGVGDSTFDTLDLNARDTIRNQMDVNARMREEYGSAYNQWLRDHPGGSFSTFIEGKKGDSAYTGIVAQYGAGYQEFSHPSVYRTQRGEDEVIEVEYRDLTAQPINEQFIGGRLYRCPRDSKTMILHTRFNKEEERLFGESTIRGYDVNCDSRNKDELGPPRIDQIPGCYTEGCDAQDNPRFDETKCLFGAGYGLNPPEDLWSSVKCGCLPGVRGHLTNWVKVMTAIKGCLQQAQIGEIRGGFCERLAAQFVCDIFIQVFKFILHTTDRPGDERGIGGLKEGIENYKYNSQRISEALEDRYGGVLKERLKLTSEDLVNKACVAAITLDWSLLDGILDNVIESVEVPPVVAVYGTSRPYGYDPFSGTFSIGYNVYVGIVPGGDTNVRAYLICDRNKDGGEYCGRGISKYPVVQVPEFLTRNDIFNENIIFVDDNAKYWYNVVCVDTEYKLGTEVKRETTCDDIKRRGDLSLLNCRFDVLVGIQCKALEQVGGPLGQIGTVQLYNAESGSQRTTPQVQTAYNGNTVSGLIQLKNSFKEDFYLRVSNGLQMFEYRIPGEIGVPGEEGLTGLGAEQTYLISLEGVGTLGQVVPQIARRFAMYNQEHNPQNAIQITNPGLFAVKLPSELSRATLSLEYTSTQYQNPTPGGPELLRTRATCDLERDQLSNYKRPYGIFMPTGFVEIKDGPASPISSSGMLWTDFCTAPGYGPFIAQNPLLAADCAQQWDAVKTKYLRVQEGHYKCLIPQDVLMNSVPADKILYVQTVDVLQHNFVTPENVDYQKSYVFDLKGTTRAYLPFSFVYGNQPYQQYGGSTRQARINVLADMNDNGQGDSDITFTEAGGVSKSQEFPLGYQVQNADANGLVPPEVELVEPLQDSSTGIRNGYFNNDNGRIPLGFVIWDDANELRKIIVRMRNLNTQNTYDCRTEMAYDRTANSVTIPDQNGRGECKLVVNGQRFIGFKAGWPSFFEFWMDPPVEMTRTQDDHYAVAVEVEDARGLKGMDTARFTFDQQGTLTAEDTMVCLGGGVCSGPYEPPNMNVFEMPGITPVARVSSRAAESYRYDSFVGGRSPYEEEALRQRQERERSSLSSRLMAEQGIQPPPARFSLVHEGNTINFDADGIDTRNNRVVFKYKAVVDGSEIRLIINPQTQKVEDLEPRALPYRVEDIEAAFSAVYGSTAVPGGASTGFSGVPPEELPPFIPPEEPPESPPGGGGWTGDPEVLAIAEWALDNFFQGSGEGSVSHPASFTARITINGQEVYINIGHIGSFVNPSEIVPSQTDSVSIRVGEYPGRWLSDSALDGVLDHVSTYDVPSDSFVRSPPSLADQQEYTRLKHEIFTQISSPSPSGGGTTGAPPGTVPYPGSSFAYNPDLNQFASQNGITLIDRRSEGLASSGPRQSSDIRYVVLHHTGLGTATSSINIMKAAGASSHFMVERNGDLILLVDPLQIAEHTKASSTIPNLDQSSIGMEIVNTAAMGDQYTPQQYATIRALLYYLEQTYSIPHADDRILAHYEVDPPSTTKTRKWDPSPNFDWSAIGLASHKELDDLMTKAECNAQIDFETTGFTCDTVFRTV